MLFTYFELAASLFILVLSFYIFSRHYANRVARFYARLAFVAFLAAVFTYSFRIAFTFEIAQNINRISVSLWTFLFVMYVHFALIFTNRDKALKNKLVTLLLYLPAIILACVFTFSNIMYTRYEIQTIGIVNQPSPYYWIFVVYGVIYALSGLYLFYSFSRNARQKSVKAQAMLIAVGSFVPLAIAVVTDEIMPLVMGYRMIVPLCVFALAAMNFSIFIAMRKYALFAITPAFAADTIIRTMPDPLIVTDLDSRILLLNMEADKLFHCKDEDLEGRCFECIFKDKHKFEKLYDEVVNQGKEIIRYEAEIIDPDGEVFPALINANLLRDPVGATLGVVYIIRDISG